MIQRDITDVLKTLISQVPVISLRGPRQAGKTSLVRELFPDFSYVNLEDPATRRFAQEDYRGFFASYPEPLIIDEVQQVPQLLSVIQVLVDEDRTRNGRFILIESQEPWLLDRDAQSLAGRTALLTLLPLSLNELKKDPEIQIEDLTPDDFLLRGFMPELYREGAREPSVYYRDYLNTYVERDVRALSEIKNQDAFLRFLTLLAGRVGEVINFSSMAGEVGVSEATLSGWLSILEASFLVFKLKPYFSNIAKQQTKSPKIYFSETGLATYLLGIETVQQVNRDPLRGHLFENLIVSEALKTRLNHNASPNLYFTRTAKGVEVDLILQSAGKLYPFEIKSGMTPNRSFSRHLENFVEAEKESAKARIIYSGQPYPSFHGVEYVNYQDIGELFLPELGN